MMRMIRSGATRLSDICKILYDNPEGLTIRQIWDKSENPPKYDVAIRQALQRLWDAHVIERDPPEIRRGRATIIWKMTPEGITMWEDMTKRDEREETIEAEEREMEETGESEEMRGSGELTTNQDSQIEGGNDVSTERTPGEQGESGEASPSESGADATAPQAVDPDRSDDRVPPVHRDWVAV